ncbi:hypothetical protein LCGC14_2705310, partial [marine sediment metagenome]
MMGKAPFVTILPRLIGGSDGASRGPRLEPVADQEAAVRDALAQPLGLPPIRELVRPGASVLIAFDDPTVPSFGPVRRLAIESILEELAGAGVPEENVNLVCANALHRKWTETELASILGKDLVRRFHSRLTCHDAEDADNLTYLGTTPSGYDVELHRLAVESDLTIYVNASCMMGFSGGWKSICVGLSTWRSIRWTHTPDGMSMSVRENRIDKVLDEIASRADQQGLNLGHADERPALRHVPDDERVDDAVHQTHDTVEGQGVPPAVIYVSEKLEGDPRKRHRGPGGAEVPPPGIETFSPPHHLRREPLGHHADPDHEPGTDSTEDEPGNEELHETVAEGESESRDGHHDQQSGEASAGPVPINQHADDDAGWDRQRDIANSEQVDVVTRQPPIRPTQVPQHGGGQR